MKKSEFNECDIYATRIAALRPFPKETLKPLREYTWYKGDEGVNALIAEISSANKTKGDA